jgi:pimeloyl-ACP methyl ester carboxylesterase
VVDIAPKDYTSHAHRAEFAAMNELDLASLRSRGDAEMKFEARVPDWAMRKFLTTNLERTEEGGWAWQINLPALTSALPALEANPLSGDDRYDGPVGFIVGGRSRYVRAEDHAAIRAHFPRAHFNVIADAGHNPHMETRPAFVAAVLAAGDASGSSDAR